MSLEPGAVRYWVMREIAAQNLEIALLRSSCRISS
jgi:hypothetical protein